MSGLRRLGTSLRATREMLDILVIALVCIALAGCGDSDGDGSAVAIERVQEASATTGEGATSLSLAWPTRTEDASLLVLVVHVLWDSTVGAIGVPPGWTLADREDLLYGSRARGDADPSR